MNQSQDIEAKAAEWLVRRDAAPNSDQGEFTAWLAADPRHRAAYLRLAAAWARSLQLKRLCPEGSKIDADFLVPKKRRPWRLGGWRPLAVAPGMVVAALVAIFWARGEPGIQTYATDIGGLSRIVLADGSTVTLNTDTELRVRMSPFRRELTLTHGEAHFVVAHDATRPFEVSAGGRLVRAVGTVFDVRLNADRAVQVIVTEGRVAVEQVPSTALTASTTTTVSAGESAMADAKHVSIQHVSATEASRRLAWKSGELSFEGESLGEVITEFNRYNKTKLKVLDPTVASLQVGGNFQPLDVDSFIAAVEHSFNVRAETAADGSVTIVSTVGAATRH